MTSRKTSLTVRSGLDPGLQTPGDRGSSDLHERVIGLTRRLEPNQAGHKLPLVCVRPRIKVPWKREDGRGAASQGTCDKSNVGCANFGDCFVLGTLNASIGPEEGAQMG